MLFFFLMKIKYFLACRMHTDACLRADITMWLIESWSFNSHFVHGAEKTASLSRAVLNDFSLLPTSLVISSYTPTLCALSPVHFTAFSLPHSFFLLHFTAIYFVQPLFFRSAEEL